MSVWNLTVTLILLVIGPLANQLGVHATIKMWVPNSNFDNPHNWDLGRLPCANDVIKFSESVPPVYVQTNTTVHEIVLPLDGELILSAYSSVAFSSSGSDNVGDNCQGGDIIYNGGTEALNWFDPKNWCDISDPEGSCMAQQNPCLDTECVPCHDDYAVFPKEATFNVDLSSGVDIFLGMLTLRGREYTTGSFRNFITSDSGRKEFKQSGHRGKTNVNIAGRMCNDLTSCPCGNDEGIVNDKICAIRESQCSETSCGDPLQPVGHCCSICGQIITMEFGSGFKYKAVERVIRRSVPSDLQEYVRVYISRLHDEKIQIVIEELNATIGVASSIANNILAKFEPDASGNTNRYKINSVKTQSTSTTKAHTSPQAVTSKNGLSPGSIASVVMAIIGVLFIVALAMYCLMEKRHPNQRPKLNLPSVRWPFRGRFSNQEDARSLELGTTVDYSKNLSMFGVEQLRGFDNPTYDTVGASAADRQTTLGEDGAENVSISTIDVDINQATFMHQGGFANPLFGDLPKIEDLSYVDSTVKMNPVYSDENIEDESQT